MYDTQLFSSCHPEKNQEEATLKEFQTATYKNQDANQTEEFPFEKSLFFRPIAVQL